MKMSIKDYKVTPKQIVAKLKRDWEKKRNQPSMNMGQYTCYTIGYKTREN